jgi:hypothetical protein
VRSGCLQLSMAGQAAYLPIAGATKIYSEYNGMNASTLSGAIDIIVVRKPDGSLASSPFHVVSGHCVPGHIS